MVNTREINFFIVKILRLPENLEVNINDLNTLIFPKKKYRIQGVYGFGAYGLILKVKSNTNSQTYALKLSRADAFSLNEFHIQKQFAEYNMAPKLHLYDITEGILKGHTVNFTRAVMDPITTTIYQYIKTGQNVKKLIRPFSCLIKKKFLLDYPNPYLHGDMHCNNIVILQDGKTLGFIDFGWSRKKPASLQILDCIPLIGSLMVFDEKLLCKSLISLYNKMFNVKLELDNFDLHPGDGYGYRIKNTYLHSYDWGKTSRRNPLPTVAELHKIFPKFDTPKVS